MLQTLLTELVAINSQNPIQTKQTENERRLAEFISTKLTQLGFQCEFVGNSQRPNLVARNLSNGPYLGFYGHLDTVAADEQYSTEQIDPLEVRIKDDWAFGLGTFDMKGGIACILEASKHAVECKIPIKLLFGIDEEQYSTGAHQLVDSGTCDNISFLIAAESGLVDDVNQPFSVVYGRSGRIGLKVAFNGTARHQAGLQYRTPIVDACEMVTKICTHDFGSNGPLPKIKPSVGQIESEKAKGLSTPPMCSFEFSLLTAPGVTEQECREIIKSAAARSTNQLTIESSEPDRPTPWSEGYQVNLDNRFLQRIQQSVFKDDAVDGRYVTSVADENVFAVRGQLPVISIGPIGKNAHHFGECVSLSSMRKVVDAYTRIMDFHKQFLTD